MTETIGNVRPDLTGEVLTPTPYAYYHRVRRQDVTTTAYTTRVPGLLVCRVDDVDDPDQPQCWVIAHWQGKAIQGFRDYGSPWQALAAANRLGELGVDWTRPSEAIKADGAPARMWRVLELPDLDEQAGQVVATVRDADDHGCFDHGDVADLLAAGWSQEALIVRLAAAPDRPLTERLRPLLAALASLEARPPWCGQCLPAARQQADEEGGLTPCPRCHPGDRGTREVSA